MKRSAPLRRYTSLSSGSGLQRRSPMPRVNHRRLRRTRAKQFGAQAALCRTLPCCACGKPSTEEARTQAAHVRSRGAGGQDRGNVVPLCACCHSQQSHLGTRRFEDRWAAGWHRDEGGRLVPVERRFFHLADVARELERLAYPDRPTHTEDPA